MSEKTGSESAQPSKAAPDVESSSDAVQPKTIDLKLASDDSAEEALQPPVESTAAATSENELSPGTYIHSPALSYLNHHWSLAGREAVESSGQFPQSLWAGVKDFIKSRVLGDYFNEERRFNERLVQYLNQLTYEVDGKYLRDVKEEHSASFHALERRFSRDLGRAVQRLESELAEVQSRQIQSEQQVQSLQAVTKGLERIVASMSHTLKSVHDSFICSLDAPVEIAKPAADAKDVRPAKDYDYVMFENRFRGSEEEIEQRLSIYPPLFAGKPGPTLEIGSGRGELLRLFKKEGVLAYGVELDQAMAELAQNRGCNVRVENGLSHLAGLPPRALSGVVAVQVVEHLDREQLAELIRLCASRVIVGGVIAFETVNPESVVALSQNYFRDPTHVAPLHPDTLSFAMEAAGLNVREVRRINAFPAQVQLQELPEEEVLTPRWNSVVEVYNRNVQGLNKLLYGYQDYCIIGEVAE